MAPIFHTFCLLDSKSSYHTYSGSIFGLKMFNEMLKPEQNQVAMEK